MSDPTPPQPPESALQFDRAEFGPVAADASGAAAGAPASLTCNFCRFTLRNVYFSAAGRVLCGACSEALQRQFLGGSRVLRALRSIAFGVGAGLLGALLYYGVTVITGYEIGLLALVVGVGVGYAVRMGSKARGGWFYQLLAVLLAYFSIGCSYSLMFVHELATDPSKLSELLESHDNDAGQLGGAASQPDSAHGASSPTAASQPTSGPNASRTTGGVGELILAALAVFVLIAFVVVSAPIFVGISSPFAFIILAIAVFEAWRMNRHPGLRIEGPLAIAGAATAAAPMQPSTEPLR